MKRDALRYLYSNAALSFLIRVGGVFALFFGNVLLARALSVEQYGQYAYLVEMAALVSVVVSLGFNQIAVRSVPDFIAGHDASALRRFTRAGVLVTALGAVAVSPLLWLGWQMGALPDGTTAYHAALALLLLAAISLMRFAQEILRGARKIVRSQILEQLAWPAIMMLAGALALSGYIVLSVRGILSIHVLAFTCFAAVLFFSVRRLGSQAEEKSPEAQSGAADNWKVWIGIGLPLAFSGLLSVFLKRGDILALGAAVSPAELAPYAAAARIAGLMIFGLAAANAVSAPLMREYFVAKDYPALQNVIDRSAAISTLFSLPLAALFLTVPELFLAAFGPEYAAGANILRILAVGQLVNALTGPVGPSMVASGMQKAYFLAVAAAAAAMIILLLVMVPAFGTMGAALSASAAAILLNGALAIVVYRKTGLRTLASFMGLRQTLREGWAFIRKQLSGSGAL